MAEWLALPTSDHGVAGSNPAGGEILPEPKRRFISHIFSCSPFHRLEMTGILLKGRKTLTHPSIHAINRKIKWTICHKCKNKRAYICHKQTKTLTPHLLSINEYPYFSSFWVKIDQLKQLKGYTMMFQYISCDFWLCLNFFSASFCHCLFSMCKMFQL